MSDRALARIDLSAVERNCAELKQRLGRATLCAVVKADGYGHGAAWCARAALAGGADWLAVATAEEAGELRHHGFKHKLLVMGALSPDELDLALASGADVVAWREGFAKLAAHKASEGGTRARLHVKLDTGMGRLGTRDIEEARTVAELAEGENGLELAGLMTHFATADEPGSGFFDEQLTLFRAFVEELKKRRPACIVHAANSAAVFRDRDAHFDMARCGIAIYGLDPFHEEPTDRSLAPALALESYVADIKQVKMGEGAGYGQTWTASSDTNLAVLPIGYGDGYRRGLSNKAEVLVRGRRHSLVGTVSMDNITIDLGPESDVRPGDVATLIGTQDGERILAEELARQLGTINYEVTCAISPRVRRLYHHDGKAASE